MLLCSHVGTFALSAVRVQINAIPGFIPMLPDTHTYKSEHTVLKAKMNTVKHSVDGTIGIGMDDSGSTGTGFGMVSMRWNRNKPIFPS